MAMKMRGEAVLYKGTEDETWGICESASVAFEADKKEIRNGQGDTVGLLYTDTGKKKFTGTYTPLAKGAATDPPQKDDLIGEALTIKDPRGGAATMTVYIDNATLARKKGDACEFNIDGYYYPNVVVPAP